MTETAPVQSPNTQVEVDLKPGNAAVFIDVENLFKPFRKEIDFAKSGWKPSQKESWNRSVEASRDAAARMLPPGKRFEDWHMEGPLVAKRLVQWFEVAGFRVEENHGRTYGYLEDHGVRAAWQTFVNKHNWNHILTQQGEDRADRAILNDVQLFAKQDLDWYFVGSQDQKLVLAESATALRPYPRKRLAAILFEWSPSIRDAFRTKESLRGITMRLNYWKMFNAVVQAEKAGKTPKRPGPNSDAQKPNITKNTRLTSGVQKARERGKRELQRVSQWAILPDAEAAAAVRHLLRTSGPEAALRTAASRHLVATTKLPDEAQRKRLADLVGVLFQERLDELITPQPGTEGAE